jgi:hypothetical protein
MAIYFYFNMFGIFSRQMKASHKTEEIDGDDSKAVKAIEALGDRLLISIDNDKYPHSVFHQPGGEHDTVKKLSVSSEGTKQYQSMHQAAGRMQTTSHLSVNTLALSGLSQYHFQVVPQH